MKKCIKYIVIGVILVALLVGIFLHLSKKPTSGGEENITLYQGNDFIEPGYEAYDENNVNLTSKVIVNSDLDINKIGEYEVDDYKYLKYYLHRYKVGEKVKLYFIRDGKEKSVEIKLKG